MKKLWAALIIIGCSSCGGDPFHPDISNVPKPEIRIERFDRDLFDCDTADFLGSVQALEKKYGSFYTGFGESVIMGGRPMDSTYLQTARLFISHPDMREVFSETQKVFPDLNRLEKEAASALRYWKFYFPEHRFPHIYAMVSGLNLPMSMSDSALGIGLDMYLGSDHRIYELAQFEKYKRRNMTPAHIIPDLIRAMGMMTVHPDGEANDLLSQMIYAGKLQLLIDLAAPDLPDTLKFGFSASQYDWCLQNESNIWAFLVKDQLIFSTEAQRIAQFMNEGPFTSGLNKASPARTGVWIGWRMVRSWISRHGLEKLHELLKKDARTLMNESAYKP